MRSDLWSKVCPKELFQHRKGKEKEGKTQKAKEESFKSA
jgi:hypothetical protein